MNQIRNQILNWHAKGHILKKNVSQALESTGANNSSKQWFNFIRVALLWLGVLSVAFGVIFFFAYNWDNISTTSKFVMIQVLMLVVLFAYTQTERYSTTNTALLFFLALLLGSLFALFGQTYQTGKDPWQLFMIWTLFVTPIAFTSRSSSLWILWLGLAYLTLNLNFSVRYGFLGILFDYERELLFYALFGVLASILFESLFYSRYKLLMNRIASQAALVASMVAFTWVAVYSIFDSNNKGLDALIYLAWMAAVYYFYRIKTVDVLVLSSWVISGIIAIISFVGRIIDNDLDGGTFLLIGLITIGLSTFAGKWLLTLSKEQNDFEKGEQK
ncbi:MAG: DUF2157 domain-containing protein [Marinicellaceae bacterium]